MSPAAIPHAHLTRDQRAVLAVLLGAGFMLSVDFSILTVALPDIGAGVGVDVERLPWVTTAFVLPAAGFTLVCGRLADTVGRRRMFRLGLALLLVASLLGGLATTAPVLLVARVLQGFATAMTLPAALSLLTTNFAEGPARDRVLGINGALLSGGFTVGALVGGTLVGLWSWRAAFFLNVPVAAAILLATPFVLAESTRPDRPRLDLPGAVTVSAGLLAVVYAVIEQHALAAVVGMLLLAAFWRIEHRAAAPLAPPRVLARRTVLWGNVAGLVIFATEPAMIFLTTLYLQHVLHLPPLVTGLVFGVPGLASVVAGMLAGRALGRFGSRRVLLGGLLVQGLATLPLVFLGADRSALLILVPALFIGFFGHVPAIVAFTVTSTSGLPDAEQGLATGLTSMTQQVAITVGIPLLSWVAATRTDELSGLRLALAVDVAVTVAAVVLVAVGLRRAGAGAPRARLHQTA
ncbi:MFS transporter [Actinomycetospora termitidis]|uniref:MFS transporter n=1 Tax=Actinomycetospora termitidis TaxID=3053470 RepID=A0ABT7M1C5_9PSEU|nr:MFS transporter [Actinomycetospora sp. Odt1-22]MDL5154461.1 MFS transporter [Actinomycetospora sp. Odt1-22]